MKSMIRWVFLILPLALCLFRFTTCPVLAQGLEQPSGAVSAPNILFIAVDDMNDWIGPLGGLEIAKTPNLDRLAAESTTFANAHCASPACASSRLANMTGVQPSKSGVMQNVWYDGPQWRDIPILENIETVETLQFGLNLLHHLLLCQWIG